RDGEGYRLLPDGRPLEIIVEAASEGSEYTDAMRLIQDSWRRIGVRLFQKNTRREMFRRRVYAGLTHIAMWTGMDYANVRADTPPLELAPTDQVQLQWSQWGLHYASKGRSGQRPTDPGALRLIELLRRWESAESTAQRRTIWHRMLQISADRVYSIGLVGGVIQPVVVNVSLRNVPKTGVWAWNPGAHLGIYRPDTFWFAKPSGAAH
ncbi:MAG: ABC transporter substrate-binding protein, partial [Rhodospirillaceae bacterium]|nr:ABC transporter substrate-binding protein [Rhodospirillaceae bacterium]